MLEPDVYCTYDGEKCKVEQINEHSDEYVKEFCLMHKLFVDLTDPFGRYKRVVFLRCSNFHQQYD